MTRFVGDAVSVRRKAKPNDTVKQLKKNLEKFAETGVHPEIERLRQERNNAIPALPDLDINRPFVFLDISVGNKPLGRLVIELYEDIVPVAASHFRNRCMPGSAAGLAGSTFHKLLPRYALYGGLSARAAEGVRMAPNSSLRAVQGGLVAISHTGEDFVLILARALDLDRTHQVVGRVHQGSEHLEVLGDLRTNPDDTPFQRVTVTRAGPTNHTGMHEELSEGPAGPPKDMATRLQEASAEARESVMEALQEGLKRRKRPADAPPEDSDGSGSGGEDAEGGGKGKGKEAAVGAKGAGTAGAQAAVVRRNVKSKMLDAMLGDLGEDSDDDDSDDDDSDGGDSDGGGGGGKGSGGGGSGGGKGKGGTSGPGAGG